MKLRLPLLLFIVFSFVAATRADSYSFKDPFIQTGPFNSTGKISLENVNGDIDVRTWDKNEIRIEGEKSAKTEEELKAVDLRMDVSESRAAIKVRLPKRSGSWFSDSTIRASVRFTLTVPTAAVLEKIETVNSSITIDGVHGAVHASSVNGGIRAIGLGADAQLHTVNGSVHASFTTVRPDQQLTFKTVNGGVRVNLPKDAGLQLRAFVANGHVDCDFPLTLGGKYQGHSITGTIGDGRALLIAEAVNGGVAIERQ
jgi:DUF4097 and DUF4098 domain-containing protein YvlB